VSLPDAVRVAAVAVAGTVFHIDKPYDYLIPEGMRRRIAPGCRVSIPFGAGNRRREGFVLALRASSDAPRLKGIAALLDDAPVLDAEGIRLALWMQKRFFCTFFEAARAMLPAGLWYTLTETIAIPAGVDAADARGILSQSPDALAVFEAVLAVGGRMPRGNAEPLCPHPDAALKELMAKGLLAVGDDARRRVGDKMQKRAQLAVPSEDALSYAATKGSSAPMQKAVLSLLCETGAASVKEICYFTGASPVVLTNLAKKGLLKLEEQEVFRRPAGGSGGGEKTILSDEQQGVFEGLRRRLDAGTSACALLHGVTGSGKTSIYLELIRHVLQGGGGAIVMVPEIVLTPQLMEVFAGAFGDQVALLHSGLSLGERLDEWKRVRSGMAPVVLGTRSAVFAPLTHLRLIIIDEEQEHTYQSENAPRYHARDVAKYRIARQNGLLLLGSATPSVESAYHARSGRYDLWRLPNRYNAMALPMVRIVDMRLELIDGNPSCISVPLKEEIERNLRRGRQSILFLNRRGYNRLLVCGSCGQAPQCVRCSVAMTYHAANGRLMCHQCGHSQPRLPDCPLCGGMLHPIGAGTQKVEEELHGLFPGVDVVRMDTDTTGGRGAHEKLLTRFRERRIPLLLGTQMVTKGLDFPLVTLVGVLDADMSLYVNDFRAGERAFGLITQVVGRAGRGGEPGRAVIQTWAPGHPVIRAGAAQDYETFYQNEIALRETQGLPPFADIVVLSLSGHSEEAVRAACLRVKRQLTSTSSPASTPTPTSTPTSTPTPTSTLPRFPRILGPAPAPILKVNNRYRYQITLIGNVNTENRSYLASLLVAFEKNRENRGVHMIIR